MNKVCLILLFTIGFSAWSGAQTYKRSANINLTDTSVVTCAYVQKDGNILVASQATTAKKTGGGVPNNPVYGEVVIRKMQPDGKKVWAFSIPNSVATVMDIYTTSKGDIIATGAFLDSMVLPGNKVFYSEEFHANAFMICLDASGKMKWANPHPVTSGRPSYYNVFDVLNDTIYVPYTHYDGFKASIYIKVFDLNGDSLNDIPLTDYPLFISEFRFDGSGNVYMAGTGGPGTKISDSTIGPDTSTFAYLTFIVKVDREFRYLWSHVYRYVTFDLYPKLAINEDKVAFMVDTMPKQNGTGNFHMLKYYNTGGQPIHYDSVGPGFFSKMHQVMSIIAVNKGFVFSTLGAFNTISFTYVDKDYHYSDMARADLWVAGNYPSFTANDTVIHYFQNYYNTYAVVNGTDSFINTKWANGGYGYQQFMMTFRYQDSILDVPHLTGHTLGMTVYPNPGKEVFHVELPYILPDKDHLNVLDISGRLVLRQEIKNRKFDLDVRWLEPGIYFLRTDNGATMKIIKQAY